MDELRIIALMTRLGYDRFYPNTTYLHSDINYSVASFQNKETDPLIFNIGAVNGHIIRAWNHVYSRYFPNKAWSEEEIEFPRLVFINKDNFVVSVDKNNVEEVFVFNDSNSFSRPVIRGVDERLDLGQLQFIVSNAGILFSLYEHPRHKLIDYFGAFSKVKDFTNQTNSIDIIVESKVLGPYGAPIELESVHILPKGTFVSQRKYNDFE